jgi:multiple sugar transport system substrate-binding protein
MLLPLGKGEWTVFMWLPLLWSGGGELTNAQFRAIAKDVELVNGGAICADAPNVATTSLPRR